MSREVHREIIGHLGTKESGMELEIHTPLGKLIVQATDTEIKILTTELEGYIRAWTIPVDDHGSIGTLTTVSDFPTIILRPNLTRKELNYMLNSPITDDQEIMKALKVWIHSDAWIESLSRAILRIRSGHGLNPSEEEVEKVQRKVLDAVRRRLV